MSKGNKAPKAPDFGPIADAATKGSKREYRLANKQFDWAKRQAKRNRHVAKPVIKALRHIMKDQISNAEEDRQRYEDTFVPLEDAFMQHTGDFRTEVDKLKKDALAYGEEPNKKFMMGRAQAGVADQFEAARKNALGTLEGFGINPSATRYAALDVGVRTAQAAAEAAAGTQAGLQVDETSRKMFSDALDRELQAQGLDMAMVNVGRGYPATVTGEYAGGQAAGQGSAGTQLATSQVDRGNRTSANDFFNSFNSTLGSWTSALDASSRAQLGEYNANQASSSGIGGILGSFAGLAKSFSFFEDGGEVDDTLSPSRGAIDDDVPTMLTAGEYVIPEEVTRHIGAKKLANMVSRARDEMGIPETA